MIIDLSHSLVEGMTVFPGTVGPFFRPLSSIEEDGYEVHSIEMNTHVGTHIDAPCHMIPNTKSLYDFPVDKFIGKAYAIDCRAQETIDLDFLKAHETMIINSGFLLFYSGWQERWNSPAYFEEYPTLSIEAIQWLLNFNLKAVGFDYISVDKLDSAQLPNHHLLLGAEVLILENLTNLDRLVGKTFEFYCLPLKIKGADGSPVRAVAQL